MKQAIEPQEKVGAGLKLEVEQQNPPLEPSRQDVEAEEQMKLSLEVEAAECSVLVLAQQESTGC